MYELSKKDANGLIEIIHESLNCETLSAFHRLVQKLKLLTAESDWMDVPYSEGDHAGGACFDIPGILQCRTDARDPLPGAGDAGAGEHTARSERLLVATERGLIFPEKNSPGSRSRSEIILHYALPHLRQALSRATQDESQKETTTLSRREREVLQWMSEGKCTWDISRILRITERTVYYHSQNIMHKLEATSRSHAVSIALKRGLIHPLN
jgi:DNA-binding CsgD family transcriptional regulator